MNILLCTDNNYVMPTGVLMTSIGENNDEKINYYVFIDADFEEGNKKVLSCIAHSYNSDISFFRVKKEGLGDYPIGREDQPIHITLAAYYRLFVSKILPKDISKIIYLDGDIVVRHSLKGLWEANIDDYAIGVVHDVSEPFHLENERLGYPRQYGYFNSGMLLINVAYWREHYCFERFSDFIIQHGDKIVMHDQDVLNAVLYKEKKWLPLTYNFQSGFIYRPQYQSYDKSLSEEIEKYKYDPTIIHYVSSSKPWNINCFFSYRGAWRYYWRRSKWRSQLLENDNPSGLKGHLRNFLLRHDLWFPDRKYQRIVLRR